MTKIIVNKKGELLTFCMKSFDVYASGKWNLIRNPRTGKAYLESYRDGWFQKYLLGIDESLCVDHINGDSLDNRISNLRVCTHLENSRNRKKQNKSATSKYLGVINSPQRYGKPWLTRITVNKKVIYLGRFDTEEEAARIRDEASVKYFGEFASLNFKNN